MKQVMDGFDPSGLRSVNSTEHVMRQEILAFSGLERGQRKSSLLALVKQAGPAIGVSEQSLYLLDQLLAYSKECDWEAGRRPIVWPSNERLCDALGIAKRTLQYRLKALRDEGLIVATYSDQERRHGRRGPDGHIISASGFDLSPIAVRAAEFERAATALREARQRRKAFRRRRTIAHKAIRMIVASALDVGLDRDTWLAIARQGEDTIAEGHRTSDMTLLERVVFSLESLQADAESHFQTEVQAMVAESVDNSVCESVDIVDETNEIAPEGAKSCTPYTTTNELILNKLSTVGSRTQSSGKVSSSGHQHVADCIDPIEETIEKYKVSPSLVASSSRFFSGFLPKGKDIDWIDIAEAGDKLHGLCGISKDAWAESLRTLGREQSAILVAIVLAKRNEIRSKGGYFRGMVRKAKNGELHIGPSLYAIRDRLDESKKTMPK